MHNSHCRNTHDTPSAALFDWLIMAGFDFFASVPCKHLDTLLHHIEQEPQVTHCPVTREEEGVGVCAGAFLGGKSPVLVMQNSGLGNSMNALASLTRYYQLPLTLVISHRGTPGEAIDAQKPMSELAAPLCELVGFDFYPLQHQRDLASLSYEGWQSRNQALVLPIGFWSAES